MNKAVDNSDWMGRAKNGSLKDSESNTILDSRTVASDGYEDGFLALHPNKRMPKRKTQDKIVGSTLLRTSSLLWS